MIGLFGACSRVAKSIALLAMSVTPAFASSSSGGYVTWISPNNAGVVIFYTNASNRTTRPSCSTQDRWSFNATTASGQAMLATLNNAMNAERLIDVIGTGTCPDGPDTEGTSYINVRTG